MPRYKRTLPLIPHSDLCFPEGRREPGWNGDSNEEKQAKGHVFRLFFSCVECFFKAARRAAGHRLS